LRLSLRNAKTQLHSIQSILEHLSTSMKRLRQVVQQTQCDVAHLVNTGTTVTDVTTIHPSSASNTSFVSDWPPVSDSYEFGRIS
jgi:hypothetical protein